MFVLLVIRKGDVVDVAVSDYAGDLRLEASHLDGGVKLAWTQFTEGQGAHSVHDDERVYAIRQARKVTW